jgi:hypothetical protein
MCRPNQCSLSDIAVGSASAEMVEFLLDLHRETDAGDVEAFTGDWQPRADEAAIASVGRNASRSGGIDGGDG